MNILRTFILAASLASLVLYLSACRKSPENPQDGNEIPAGTTRINGTVVDLSGAPLPNVAIHIVYDFEPQPDMTRPGESFPSVLPNGENSLDEGSAAQFRCLDTLYTECGGSTPIPDGVPVKIFWDVDSNGADSTDPQPPICSDPPDCHYGPSQTVNYSEFPVNGAEHGLPGIFVTTRYFACIGAVLNPNRFYLRIYCSDGNVLYTSDPVNVNAGVGVYVVHMACTPCNGAPDIPQWTLSQAYPNPATDHAIVRYSLAETSTALLTMQRLSTTRVDTMVNEHTGSGWHGPRYEFASRPNGLYEYRLTATGISQTGLVLKNSPDEAALRNTDGATNANSDGHFSFDAFCAISIFRRDENGDNIGDASLDRAHVIALLPGYQIADTLVTLADGEERNLSITLRPQ